MKITYLGTGSSEGFPAPFCQCESCAHARAAGGKNLRFRTAVLINDDLLFDVPPDLYAATLAAGISLAAVEDFVVTHAHGDHLYVDELANLAPPFSYRYGKDAGKRRLHGSLWTTGNVAVRMLGDGGRFDAYLSLFTRNAFETFQAGKYTVTVLPAKHADGRGAFLYVLTDGQKTLFYGNDSGYYLDETLAWLKESGLRFDLVSFDCNSGMAHDGPQPGGASHMTVPENIQMKKWFLQNGCADEKTIFVSTHVSHNSHMLHEDLEAKLTPEGIVMAYDGMILNI